MNENKEFWNAVAIGLVTSTIPTLWTYFLTKQMTTKTAFVDRFGRQLEARVVAYEGPFFAPKRLLVELTREGMPVGTAVIVRR